MKRQGSRRTAQVYVLPRCVARSGQVRAYNCAAQVWEFKHPEFRADRKDNLDSIRRKAPAKNKGPGDDTSLPMTQQITLLNEQILATQQQVQDLQESYTELSQTSKLFINEIMNLQKMVKAQGQVHRELLDYLDDRRRTAQQQQQHQQQHRQQQVAGSPFVQTPGGLNLITNPAGGGGDAAEEVAELRRAREILNGIPQDPATERELERLLAAYQTASPPDSVGSGMAATAMFAQPGAVAMGLSGAPGAAPGVVPHAGGPPHAHLTTPLHHAHHDSLGEMRHMVYPVGHNNGIDPFHQDHIHNIPYSRPIADPNALAEAPPVGGGPVVGGGPALMSRQQRSQQQQRAPPLWTARKPQVLLVEDDPVCSKIGAKFLSQMDCLVEVAVSVVCFDPKKHPVSYSLFTCRVLTPNPP